MNVSVWETWIFDIELKPSEMLRFEARLLAEPGLAVARGGTQPGHCELWTTWAQRDRLRQWIEQLAPAVQVRLLRERPWGRDA